MGKFFSNGKHSAGKHQQPVRHEQDKQPKNQQLVQNNSAVQQAISLINKQLQILDQVEKQLEYDPSLQEGIMLIGDTVGTFGPKRKKNARTTHSNSRNVTLAKKNLSSQQ